MQNLIFFNAATVLLIDIAILVAAWLIEIERILW